MRRPAVVGLLLLLAASPALAAGPRKVPTEVRFEYGVLRASAPRVYVVRKDDTLGEIAQRELGTVRALADLRSWNPGVEPKRIRPGQRLFLPSEGPYRLYAYGPEIGGRGLERVLPDRTLRGALRLVAVPAGEDEAFRASMEAAEDLRDAVDEAARTRGLLLSEPLPGHVRIAEGRDTRVVRLRYRIARAGDGRLDLEEIAWAPDAEGGSRAEQAPPPTWALVLVLLIVLLTAFAFLLRTRAR